MKARDELRSATLRMVLTAVRGEEVAGKSARTLSDEEVVTVLQREAKKRREAAEAYDGAGRVEQAERERGELGVIETYLPTPLTDEELTELVDEAVLVATAEGLTAWARWARSCRSSSRRSRPRRRQAPVGRGQGPPAGLTPSSRRPPPWRPRCWRRSRR